MWVINPEEKTAYNIDSGSCLFVSDSSLWIAIGEEQEGTRLGEYTSDKEAFDDLCKILHGEEYIILQVKK